MRYVIESKFSDGTWRVDEHDEQQDIEVTETDCLLIFEWINDCGGERRITVIKNEKP